MFTSDWNTQVRPRSPKPYENIENKKNKKQYLPKQYQGSKFNNETGLYQEILWDNTTRFAKNKQPTDQLNSVQLRAKKKDDDGLFPEASQYINYPPTLNPQNAAIKQYKQSTYVPPHSIIDRKESILQRNRWIQENNKRVQQEAIQSHISKNKHGINNIISLVKSDYQVPVAITKQRHVVGINNVKQNSLNPDYFDTLQKVYQGLK
ncbi:hypothetical protein SS50377_21189 [Spironucleus salmonicida]|uniref:Uncharacterized protein n=1 Tax=Spironucleus salmonicida TaxID=348837 RepID=V6LHC5_9EUKA|nr:hypothetical protein SS50377_21189 [Spironucleus salmonicida]|eukprot:EST43965.1 Hypothetical protein SS50377_16272 [Spironucleus salmonicida]